MFNILHLPVPWLLGPLFAVLISQFFIKFKLYCSATYRNIGLVIVGTSIGQVFQFDLFKGMGSLIFYMILINLALLVASILLALGVRKFGNTSLKTAITCTVPGGLSQIVVFAEEEKDIDLAVVSYFHVVRIIGIVMLVPFIISGHAVHAVEGSKFTTDSIVPLAILLAAAFGTVVIGKRLKLPVASFLSPVLLMILLNLLSIDTPKVPSTLLHIAQLLIGAYIGLLLKPDMIKLGKRVFVLGVGSALLLLAITMGQGIFLMKILGYSLTTSFLSTAAGGLDQMSLLASAVGADVSVVTVFQLFRLLFIFIIVLPLLKVTCSYIDRWEANKTP